MLDRLRFTFGELMDIISLSYGSLLCLVYDAGRSLKPTPLMLSFLLVALLKPNLFFFSQINTPK